MDKLLEYLQKQNNTFQNIAGMGSIQSLSKALDISNQFKEKPSVYSSIASLTQSFAKQTNPYNQNIAGIMGNNLELFSKMQKTNNLSAITGITNLTKHLAFEKKPYNPISAVLGNNLDLYKAMDKLPKNNFPLSALTSSLAQLSKRNDFLSNSISDVVSSQLLLSNSLAGITKLVSNSHLNKFNVIEAAILGVTNDYLKDTFKTKKWEDLEVVEEVNDIISSTADSFINDETLLTLDDLNDFKESLFRELRSILSASKTPKVRLLIMDLITIISFIITLYTNYKPNEIDVANKNAIEETRKEIKKLREEIPNIIKYELSKLNKIRVSTTNVNLRYSPKKKCKIIGLVKKGQEVSVIDIHHKYLLISYLDMETGEPKSGFVVKKYFKH